MASPKRFRMGARVEWIGPELPDDPDIPPPGIHGSVISPDPPGEWVVSWDNGATAVYGEKYLREVDEPERPPGGSLLYVSRPNGRGFRRDRYRRYRVLVDDREVATLKEGESYVMDLVPGSHAVRAKIDWATTPPLEFDVLLAEKVKLVVRPGGGPWMTLRDLMVRPSSYLALEREEA